MGSMMDLPVSPDGLMVLKVNHLCNAHLPSTTAMSLSSLLIEKINYIVYFMLSNELSYRGVLVVGKKMKFVGILTLSDDC